MKFDRKHLFFIPILFLLGGFFGALLFEHWEDEETTVEKSLRATSMNFEGGKLTNPLLDCAEINTASDRKVLEAKHKVEELIANQKRTSHIADASVYFRDLNNGPWFGVNATNADFYPASLLKVPLMMAVYKQAMLQPGFINKQVEVTDNGFNNIETIKSSNYLKKGQVKSVADVVESMVKYSDNNASHILNGIVDQGIYDETYKDLGIELPDKPDYFISVRTYASFFRILYNATYLWEPFSQHALELLTESEYKDGLVAGVPGNVKVAHKFGERQLPGQKQLHDCGIIYNGNNPYVLCVMTRGQDNAELAETIKNISETVYDTLNGK